MAECSMCGNNTIFKLDKKEYRNPFKEYSNRKTVGNSRLNKLVLEKKYQYVCAKCAHKWV